MFDFPAFWAREVLPRLEAPPRRPGAVILHPTCTLVKAGGLADLVAVARAHAETRRRSRASPSAAASPATRASPFPS